MKCINTIRWAVVALALLLPFSVVTHAQVVAIKAGKLVDPETGTTSVKQVIIVEGRKIKAVGQDLPIPTGAQVVDLSNATVLPGLFDAHTHLCLTIIKERDNQRYIYSEDDIRFIVEEAGKAGLKVAAHCWTEQAAKNAAAAGVASIEHGFDMSDATLELAKKNNVALVGTEFPEAYLRESGLQTAVEEHKHWVDRLRRAFKIGVTLVYGTDAALGLKDQTRGTEAISFIESYIEAGVPAKTTLQAMTVNAARLLGVEKESATIKPGMYADIIATPENPLDNIRTLKQVSFVMKNGSVFKKPS